MSVSKMQDEEPYCGPGFQAGAGPPCSCVVLWMAIGGKVMKMATKSSMGAGQEMRKGNKTTTTARAGEKTKNLQDMITTVMLYTIIM